MGGGEGRGVTDGALRRGERRGKRGRRCERNLLDQRTKGACVCQHIIHIPFSVPQSETAHTGQKHSPHAASNSPAFIWDSARACALTISLMPLPLPARRSAVTSTEKLIYPSPKLWAYEGRMPPAAHIYT